MKNEEILERLEFFSSTFPRRALQEAVARKESITPALLDIVSDAARDVDLLVNDTEYMAHIYAMYLLAQFRETRAYPLIVDFFSAPGDVTLDVTGDLVTEDLNRILASVSGGDTRLIDGMIEDETINEYVRGAALEALLVLVARGDRTIEEVTNYYRGLFRGGLEREPSFVWANLVSCCCDLAPNELMEDITQAFEDGLVIEGLIDWEFVQELAARDQGQILTELQGNHHYSYIDDTVREMEWWACFDEPKPKIQRKVGRNEPCPCGSGKKYKKCCGAKRRKGA